MKTKSNAHQNLRLLVLISLGFILQSCGAFYPYAYYSPSNRNARVVYYQNEESPNKYQSYFKDKALEYDEILGDEVIISDGDVASKSNNNKESIEITINTVPSYSWGFNHYWDSYYYSPYAYYGSMYSPFFYDSWYYRSYSGIYNYNYPYFHYGLSFGWGSNWYSPYYGYYSYYHPIYRYPKKNRYYTYQNRGRNNHQRSVYQTGGIASYSPNRYSNTRTRSSATNRSYNSRSSRTSSDYRSSRNSSVPNMRSTIPSVRTRSNVQQPNRTRSYTRPNSSSSTRVRSNIPTRSVRTTTPRKSYSRPSSTRSRSTYNSSSPSRVSRPAVTRSSNSSRGNSSSSRKKN